MICTLRMRTAMVFFCANKKLFYYLQIEKKKFIKVYYFIYSLYYLLMQKIQFFQNYDMHFADGVFLCTEKVISLMCYELNVYMIPG